MGVWVRVIDHVQTTPGKRSGLAHPTVYEDFLAFALEAEAILFDERWLKCMHKQQVNPVLAQSQYVEIFL